MQVEKMEITLTFRMREIQSLLMVLRRIEEDGFKRGLRTVSLGGITPGAVDDMQGIRDELEQALLMDQKLGA